MKNMRNVIIALESIVIVVLAIVIVRLLPEQKRNNINTYEQKISVKEVNKEVPDFTLYIRGAYGGRISKKQIEEKGIKLYEFDATLNTWWDQKTDHYVGYRVLDILDAFDIKDYSTLTFESATGKSVRHLQVDIDSDYYIVFYMNDKLTDEENPVMLLTPRFNSNYSMKRLVSLDFGFSESVIDKESQESSNNENNSNTDNNEQ